jgi:uncharacterized protein YpmS
MTDLKRKEYKAQRYVLWKCIFFFFTALLKIIVKYIVEIIVFSSYVFNKQTYTQANKQTNAAVNITSLA